MCAISSARVSQTRSHSSFYVCHARRFSLTRTREYTRTDCVQRRFQMRSGSLEDVSKPEESASLPELERESSVPGRNHSFSEAGATAAVVRCASSAPFGFLYFDCSTRPPVPARNRYPRRNHGQLRANPRTNALRISARVRYRSDRIAVRGR